MRFDSKKTAFGRHETFFLRYGWLTKGFWKYLEYIDKSKTDIFKLDDAVVELGVGKNMVASIRYWLHATQLLQPDNSSSISTPSQIGLKLMGAAQKPGWDPYLEDEGTLWLLHWLIASNSASATTFFWFFNSYHKTHFTQDELRTALSDFVKESVGLKVSPATIKNDIAVLTRMYASTTNDGKQSWDDVLDSPMAALDLIESGVNREFKSYASLKNTLPAEIVGYALSQIFEQRKVTAIPVSELIYSQEGWPAIGAVFRLQESQALSLIEDAIDLFSEEFEINESAGIHQVYKTGNLQPIEFLSLYYAGNEM
ncbi:DUF4007 family protein [Shewanella oncorhynchi]|uniref:DUF4007 family protein n=1 Tax=Shewanella oncorhynchi TaxID=2726434 RepID=UPI003746DC32